MAEWKPFDLKWGRSIWYCSACEESTEVPTYLGTPMYNFCPMCGANMNMKSKNCEIADTPQTEKSNSEYYLELADAVMRGEMSDAEANQAWYEYINKQDVPQTDCGWK